MKHRIILLVPALVAMLAGLLVAAPAEAASHSAFLLTKGITISTKGKGKVQISCHGSKACTGTIRFAGSVKKKSYSVPGRSTRYVAVAINTGSKVNPHTHGTSVNGQYKRVSATLKISETSPRKVNHQYAVSTETALRTQQITGTVAGPDDSTVRDLRVELVRSLRGGNTEVVRFDDDLSNGYSFNVLLGTNNAPSSVFRLRVSGTDQDGTYRSWYWRGSDGKTTGGARYFRNSSPVRAVKSSNFDANFRYSSVKGTAPTGTVITVAAPPSSFNGDKVDRRELDLVGCANVFGETTATSGQYRVDFLPLSTATPDRRYMIGAAKGGDETWNNDFGSCFDVLDYRYSRSNLLALGTTARTVPIEPLASNNQLAVNGSFSGFKGTKQGDRWIRLREKVPGLPILDAPVVAEKAASTGANATFYGLRPGRYWVEVGRRTGCADWYPSRFPDNRAYFSGEDRGAERWKSFTKLSALPGSSTSGLELLARTADPNPATDAEQGKVPAGRAGWMYRAHCKAVGAGSVNTVNVTGRDNGTIAFSTSTDKKGAVVKGHVTRLGGRTNKEVLVRLSSTDGKRVIRTDIADGGGNFYVSGLAPGKWTISVNTDSWRGIERAFTGRHVVTVRSSGVYSAGTLRFRG